MLRIQLSVTILEETFLKKKNQKYTGIAVRALVSASVLQT